MILFFRKETREGSRALNLLKTRAFFAPLSAAAAQIPGMARSREAQPLAQRLDRIDKRRGRGPDACRRARKRPSGAIRDVLVQLLAKLGGVAVELKSSEDQVPA